MATIRDVASRAGVGVGTVSRVINGGHAVSAATRQRVSRAIDELGYRPSPAARALSRGRAQTVAVTAPFLTRPSVVERVRGVVDALAGSDYDLSLATVETPEQRARRLSEAAQRDRADGALLISLAPTPEEEAALAELDAPIVVLDSYVESLPSVRIDDVAGGRLAGECLLALGHRRIAYIGDRVDDRFHFHSSDDRLMGLKAALADAGAEPDDDLVRLGDHDRHTAALQAAELLALRHRPTAVFASSDTQALGVLEACRAAGLRVPEDVSVLGFDDIEVAEIVGLSTIRQSLQESGRMAAELLLVLLGGDPPPRPAAIEVPLAFVERRTTGAPPRTSRQRPPVGHRPPPGDTARGRGSTPKGKAKGEQ